MLMLLVFMVASSSLNADPLALQNVLQLKLTDLKILHYLVVSWQRRTVCGSVACGTQTANGSGVETMTITTTSTSTDDDNRYASLAVPHIRHNCWCVQMHVIV